MMTWVEVLDWSLRLYDWAKQMAQAQGLTPEQFETKAAERATAAQKRADEQRAAELAAMK
jgi:hypothetical protein